ncbi:hypothetical protein HDU96_006287 [Phlyctochytrium bullatum]|nr:hypothetical protein HDU96_006287 [Phlyctochytrium bullatum]
MGHSQKYLDAVAAVKVPKLFVIGDRDNFANIADLTQFVSKLDSKTSTMETVRGVDHFWFGHEDKIVGIVADWLRKTNLL